MFGWIPTRWASVAARETPNSLFPRVEAEVLFKAFPTALNRSRIALGASEQSGGGAIADRPQLLFRRVISSLFDAFDPFGDSFL